MLGELQEAGQCLVLQDGAKLGAIADGHPALLRAQLRLGVTEQVEDALRRIAVMLAYRYQQAGQIGAMSIGFLVVLAPDLGEDDAAGLFAGQVAKALQVPQLAAAFHVMDHQLANLAPAIPQGRGRQRLAHVRLEEILVAVAAPLGEIAVAVRLQFFGQVLVGERGAGRRGRDQLDLGPARLLGHAVPGVRRVAGGLLGAGRPGGDQLVAVGDEVLLADGGERTALPAHIADEAQHVAADIAVGRLLQQQAGFLGQEGVVEVGSRAGHGSLLY